MRTTRASDGSREAHIYLLLLLLIFGASAFAPSARAEEEISTDRPDFVESSDVVPKDAAQLELGLSYERDNGVGLVRTLTTPTLFRYGIGSGLEVRVETDGFTTRKTDFTERGFSDLSLGVKWHARDGDASTNRPALAVLLHADLPSGSSAFRGEGVRPSLRGVAEWDVGTATSIGVMPGIVYDQSTQHRFWSGILATTMSTQLAEKWHGFVEIAAQQIAHTDDGGNTITFDTGLTYLLRNSLELDCAVFHGLNNAAPDWTFEAGLSIRW